MQSNSPGTTALRLYQESRALLQVPQQSSQAPDLAGEVAVPAAFVAHPVLSANPADTDGTSTAQPAPSPIPAEESSVIPSQITFAGDATFDCDVRIAGNITGTVTASAGRSINVEKGATVNGTLKATNVRIDGTTEGEISAEGGLASFTASAVSKGHITYSRLRIVEGAEVEASMKKLAA